MRGKITILLTAMGLVLAVTTVEAQSQIKIRGSETMMPIAMAWAEAYHKIQPNVTIDVRGCGSSTGIASLINGTAEIANMSRPLKKKELAEAQANMITPQMQLVGYDALAIFVHKDNPVQWVSINNLAEMYGEGGKLDNWSKLAVMVPACAGNNIRLIGRTVFSGTHDIFREMVLGDKRDFKHGAMSTDVTDPEEVLELVAKDPCAIGYSGMAHELPNVKKLKIAMNPGSAVIEPSMQSAIDRTYPLVRSLFMVSNGESRGEVKAYLDWILSDEGQCVERKIGYAPVRSVTCK